MKNTFDSETLERTGVLLDSGEALLLYRLVSKLTRDDLVKRGFTREEAEVIEAWHGQYTD